MSNFLAIATVTEALKLTLQTPVRRDVSGADVTALRPDSANPNLPNPGVNLYLYQVTPNAAWRNQDLPTRRSGGELVQRPQVALNLHYLLTFYGKESDLEPQRLLGSVTQTLHAHPVLGRKQIEAAITSSAFLATSNLADAVEKVKFTPLSLSLEELAKLWSVLFQTVHALSLIYEGSVVLIESDSRPQQALPVRDRNLYAIPFRQPTIERVQSQDGVNEPILVNSTLLIEGRQLEGDITRVLMNGSEITANGVSESQIRLSLASLPPNVVLRAGLQALQIVQFKRMGNPPQPHRGFESNVAPFVLHPSITVTLTGVTCTPQNGVTRCLGTITVNFTPNIGRNQRVILLLNEFNPPNTRSPLADSFNAPPQNGISNPNQTDTAAIAFAVSQVVQGTYLVRVQVDGASSLLAVDTNEMSLTFNQYLNPRVTF